MKTVFIHIFKRIFIYTYTYYNVEELYFYDLRCNTVVVVKIVVNARKRNVYKFIAVERKKKTRKKASFIRI